MVQFVRYFASTSVCREFIRKYGGGKVNLFGQRESRLRFLSLSLSRITELPNLSIGNDAWDAYINSYKKPIRSRKFLEEVIRDTSYKARVSLFLDGNDREMEGSKWEENISSRTRFGKKIGVSRRLFTLGGGGGGGGHRIDQLSLSLSLGTRIVAEERAGLALEIFLASSIYSPPRCSFYTTFFRYRFCVGKGEEEGIRQ